MLKHKKIDLIWSIHSNVRKSIPLQFAASLLNKTYGLLFKNLPIVIDGQKYYAHSLDRMVALIFLKYKINEEMETSLLKKMIKKNWRVIDIGANIGYYTILLGKLVGDKGEVYAFEPDKDNVSTLSTNVLANNFNNIKVIEGAISDNTGTTKLYVSKENNGDHRTYNNGEKRKSYDVNSYSLDSFFSTKKRIDFIKIDIQGSEMQAFLGMKNILKNNPNIIIICEFWPEGLLKAGYTPLQFLTFIKKLGFKISYFDKNQGARVQASTKELLHVCSVSNYTNLLLHRHTLSDAYTGFH